LTKKCAPARLAAAVRRTLERAASGRCEPWRRRASPEYSAAALSPPRTRALRTLDRKSTPLARPARRATLGRRRAEPCSHGAGGSPQEGAVRHHRRQGELRHALAGSSRCPFATCAIERDGA